MPIVAQFRAHGNPAPLEAALSAARIAAQAALATAPDIAARAPGTAPSAPQPGPGVQTESPPAPAPPASATTTLPLPTPLAAPPLPPPRAEDIPLWLPSSLPPLLRSSLAPGLADKERRLRLAQADDALEDIRRLRRILTGIVEFKRLNVTGTGQRSTLKVRSLYTKFQDKVKRAAERYRAARAALERLDESGDWRTRFKVLLESDLRGPGRDEDDRSSEGRWEMSWIWRVPRGPGQVMPQGVEGELDPGEFLENVKVEWARSKARAERWAEEVELLQEEMRRVIEYFEWKASWWRKQASRRTDIATALQRGLGAYAELQARVFEGLAFGCASLWVPYFRAQGDKMPEWSARYDVPYKVDKKGGTRVAHMPADARAGASVSTTLPADARADSAAESDSGDSDSDSSTSNDDM